MEQGPSTQERSRLIAELVSSCQTLAGERIDRYLRVQHHGIVAGTSFASASAECIELFRDGHFYGAISLSQAVGEALVRHMCMANQCRPTKDFVKNVATLKRGKFIDDSVAVDLLRLWELRNEDHHLNPTIVTDRSTLEALALTKIQALAAVEKYVFAWAPGEGAIKLLRPQYWPDKRDGRVPVFLRRATL